MKFKIEVVIDAGPRTVWQMIDGRTPNIDTVTERREPHFMAGTRESSQGTTLIVNHFEELDEGHTRWIMYANHSFRGVFKVLGLFTAGSIRRHNEDLMNNFKLFVETEQAQQAR